MQSMKDDDVGYTAQFDAKLNGKRIFLRFLLLEQHVFCNFVTIIGVYITIQHLCKSLLLKWTTKDAR